MIKRFVKRLLVWGLVGIFALGTAAFFLGDPLLDIGTRKGITLAVAALKSLGIDLKYPEVGDAHLDLPATARWEGLTGRFEVSEESPLGRSAGFDMRIGSVSLRPTSLTLDRFSVSAHDIYASSVYLVQPAYGQRVTDVELRVEAIEKRLAVSLFDPTPGLRAELQSIRSLLREGLLDGPVSLKGRLSFKIDGQEVVMNIRAEPRENGYGLVTDEEPVRELARLFARTLMPAEISMVSRYPLQAAEMLRIQDYATEQARERHAQDAAVPEDAYRHLLWSYLLTKRFGDRLAKEITDAHEIGSLTNTAADHRMDYHNNDLGRRYAAEGRSEAEIETLAKSDPAVIRVPK